MNIYVDHAATTQVHPQVLEVMLPMYHENFGNPSSVHAFGRKAKAVLDDARNAIAAKLHCHSSELIFTSGGTESDNLAILGAARGHRSRGKHVITTQIEHRAVLDACAQLEMDGFEVTYVPVDHHGRVSVPAILEAIRDDTVLISVMMGNNEVGTIQPIAQIGQAARERGIVFHTDAVQALGVLEIDLSQLPVDLMSLSAHKIGGTKGTGLLYVNKGVHLQPRQFGGSQERKMRSGTENVAGICGMAKALMIATEQREAFHSRMLEFRTALLAALEAELPEGSWTLNSPEAGCLPQIVNVSFPGCSFESMLMNLDLEGIAASSGSACTSGSLQVSHVLQAMQVSDQIGASAIRFSFGASNRSQDVHIIAQKLKTIVPRIRINS